MGVVKIYEFFRKTIRSETFFPFYDLKCYMVDIERIRINPFLPFRG